MALTGQVHHHSLIQHGCRKTGNYNFFKNSSYKQISLLLRKLWSKFQLLIDILAVQYSMVLVGIWYNQTGSGNRQRKIQDGCLHTGTTYISACRWDRNKISTAKPTFSRAGNREGLGRISFLSRLQVEIKVFQVYSRHLVFSTSGLVVQYSL